MAVGDAMLLNGVKITLAVGTAPVIAVVTDYAKILSWNHAVPDRVTVDASDCSTSGAKPFLAAPDFDPGVLQIGVRFFSNSDATFAFTSRLSTTEALLITITFFDTGTFACKGWLTGLTSQGAKDGILDMTLNFKLTDAGLAW